MYEVTTISKRAEKEFYKYLNDKISKKLKLLQENPRKNLGAHPLHGKLKGKWSCWLGSNIRIIYEIDEILKEIIVFSVGSHKIYL